MVNVEGGLSVGYRLVQDGGEGKDRVGVVGGQQLLLVLVVKVEIMLKELR